MGKRGPGGRDLRGGGLEAGSKEPGEEGAWGI